MQKFFLPVLFLLPFFSYSQRSAQMIDGPRGNKIGFIQFLPPGYSKTSPVRHPLIIFLHGIGEKGTGLHPDIDRLDCCGIPKYIEEGNTMEFSWLGKTESFVVLYPQLASKYGTWQTYYVEELLRYAKKSLNIDSDRVFLTGLSLGGGGTWVYASASLHNAQNLAGIVPVVSPCFMTNGCNIANAKLPVLAIHVLDDKMASPNCTINAIKSINDCGAEAKPNLVMYQTGSHYIWVKRAYDTSYDYFSPNVYEWMLAQNRRLKPNIKPVANAGKNVTISGFAGSAVLDASASTDPDGKIVRYVWQKTSGPAAGILHDEVTANPRLTGLNLPGVYTFQVRAIDDRAEWSTADVKITVVDAGLIN
jgi:predicted esterase